MKKFLTILSVAAATILSVNAQDATSSSDGGSISQGNMYLTGEITFSSTSNKDANNADNKSIAWTREFAPKFGYMITDQIGVHVTGGYSSVGNDNNPDDNQFGRTTSNGYIIGVGGQYFMPVTDKFYFNPALDLEFRGGTVKSNPVLGGDLEDNGSYSSFGFAITPNFTYFLANKWSMNLGWGEFGYTSQTNKDANGDKTDTDGNLALNADLTSVNFGVSFWFK